MIAKGDWVLATPLEQDKTRTGIVNPDGIHKYFLKVYSVGDDVESCEEGDIILPASTLGWSQINGVKYNLLKASQVGAVAEESDLEEDEDTPKLEVIKGD